LFLLAKQQFLKCYRYP